MFVITIALQRQSASNGSSRNPPSRRRLQHTETRGAVSYIQARRMREQGSGFAGNVNLALFMLRGGMLVSNERVVSRGGKVSEHCQLWWG